MSKKFDVGINKGWCKGCGLCAAVCPKSVLALNDRGKIEAVKEDCIGCRQCENICPDLALTIKEGGANA